uniref:acylneuraminate cytidylyltransferase family protein n=1 Tax=Algoriphagus sp. TaxID=1872435 RepID=UPI004048122F
MKKILCVVPARGGSKGLPGKNIKMLIDKPLIAWSIEQGLGSKYVNEVIVSTDSEEVAEIAKNYGARVPFLRPDFLAQDDSSTADVLVHMMNELEKIDETFDYILLLEPTSPLREVNDIDKAFEQLFSIPQAKSIVGISKVESQHPSFTVSLQNESNFIQSKNNFKVLRRQEIEELYFYEGSLYISEIKSYREKKNFYHKDTLGYIMPKSKSLEIDDEVDFIMTEALLLARQKNLI